VVPPVRGGRASRRRALAGLVVGLALLIVPAAVWLSGLPAPARPAPAAEASAVPVPPDGGVCGARCVDDTGRAPAAPVRIRIDGIGVDAPVSPVGVDDRGRMAVPLDVATVGWYRYGPGPGAAGGSAVLSGHVDDYEQGLGAFYRLADLEAGDPVTVELADGTALDYRVRDVERVAKADLPVDRVFARDGAPHLSLVTCGGAFNRATSGYTDNVVVVAEPDPRP
jgi:LPXTG-site transpeptidase (sortase) family protein